MQLYNVFGGLSIKLPSQSFPISAKPGAHDLHIPLSVQSVQSLGHSSNHNIKLH